MYHPITHVNLKKGQIVRVYADWDFNHLIERFGDVELALKYCLVLVRKSRTICKIISSPDICSKYIDIYTYNKNERKESTVNKLHISSAIESEIKRFRMKERSSLQELMLAEKKEGKRIVDIGNGLGL